MTVTEERPLEGAPPADQPLDTAATDTGSARELAPGATTTATSSDAQRPDRPVGIGLTCAAAAASTLAAGWMLGGVFAGVTPKLIALVAACVGPVAVLASYRTSRPAVIQYLMLPLAVLAGALVVLPATSGGSANLPSLVDEAVRAGGLGQPPVPFEPGWRFILVVLLTLLGAGAASAGVSLERPKLAIALPLPIIIGAALVQPTSSAAIASVIALVLIVAALILASGAQLIQEGSSSSAFEARRLLRGLASLLLLAAILVPLSQTGFLFPASRQDRVVPPMRPEQQPPLSDRVLYTVRVAPGDQGPWRFGVLDVYDGSGWLLPPYDQKRFVTLNSGGDLALATAGLPPRPADGPASVPTAGAPPARTVTFTVNDLPGRVLPSVEGARAVMNGSLSVQFDPRTQTLRSTDGRPPRDAHYTVQAAQPADSTALAAAPPADPRQLATYLQVPAPPQAVATLLAQAPTDNMFRRLQFVRNQLYAHVIAAGKGTPVDVPPARVDEMLNGGKATPFEITAAEALLARWAGVPARLGYGFYSGTESPDQTSRAIHPRDGATWLEAYFPGNGWLTIVGRPPKAQASTSLEQRNRDPHIKASDDLALIVHVPIELTDLHQIYETIRYYAVISLPWIALLLLMAGFYPAGLKQVRRLRRVRWARAHGPAARILVAYAGMRDRLRDINAPQPTATPLEFVAAISYDEEHWELAWLVTRALWGDLRRDVREGDVEAAEAMAGSVGVRVLRAQRIGPRLLGLAARTSLRDPWSTEIPNFWPSGARLRAMKARLRRAAKAVSPARAWRGRSRWRSRRGLQTATSLVLLAVLLSGCGAPAAAAPPTLPQRLLPDSVGNYLLQHEPEAERAFADAGKAAIVSRGTVYTIRRGAEVFASFQAAQFLPKAANDRRRVEKALRANIGSGNFTEKRVGSVVLYELQGSDGRILLWFPPGGGYYEMIDARSGFTDAERVFLALLDYQRGATGRLAPTNVILTDVRRGGD